jgi:hypothetical protein
VNPVVLATLAMAVCGGVVAPYLIQGAALVLLADWRWGLELGWPGLAAAAGACSALHAVLWRRFPEAAAVLGLALNAIWIGAGAALGRSEPEAFPGPAAGIVVGVVFTLATNGTALMRWRVAVPATRPALEV